MGEWLGGVSCVCVCVCVCLNQCALPLVVVDKGKTCLQQNLSPVRRIRPQLMHEPGDEVMSSPHVPLPAITRFCLSGQKAIRRTKGRTLSAEQLFEKEVCA